MKRYLVRKWTSLLWALLIWLLRSVLKDQLHSWDWTVTYGEGPRLVLVFVGLGAQRVYDLGINPFANLPKKGDS